MVQIPRAAAKFYKMFYDIDFLVIFTLDLRHSKKYGLISWNCHSFEFEFGNLINLNFKLLG